MSKQRRSFFALKCDSAYCAEVPAIPSLSLCGGDSFTISATFMYPHAGDDSIIIQQEGVFCVHAKDSVVYFESKGLGNIQAACVRTTPALSEKEWNRIDITYDGKSVKIYVQSLLVTTVDVTGEKIVDETTRLKIGAMNGYIQDIAIYSIAVDEIGILQLPFTQKVSHDKTQLWIDFNAYEPVDQGINELPVQMKGSCNVVNLVYGFEPGLLGFALPFGSGQINPGAMPKMTLFASVFPRELSGEYRLKVQNQLPNDSNTFIFSNGDFGDAQTVALGLDELTNYPFLYLGSTRYDFQIKLNNYEWYQLAATVTDQQVSLFVDGVDAGTTALTKAFKRTLSPELMVGNQQNQGEMNHGFRGCIDTIAVFNEALTVEDLAAFVDIPPYRFENSLSAMWLFSQQYPSEILTGRSLTYSSGTKGSTLQENTVLGSDIPVLDFHMPNVSTKMDEITTWETRVQAETYIQSINALTGLKPIGGFVDDKHTVLNGSIANLVCSSVGSNNTLCEICYDGKCSKTDLSSIIAGATLGGFLGAACFSLYTMAQQGGFRRFIFMERFFYILRLASKVSSWPSIGAALGAGAAAVTNYIINNPTPDSGTCTSSDFKLSFKSLAFYSETNKESGILFGVQKFGEKPVLPEWTPDKSAPVLCYRNFSKDKTPSVTLTFDCELLCGIPIDITFEAEPITGDNYDDILGSLISKEVHIEKSGTYSVSIPLSQNKLRTSELKEHGLRWQWRCSCPDVGTKLIGKTEHSIHVIDNMPRSPWTLEVDSDYLPLYPAIKICHEIAAVVSTVSDAEQKFADCYVKWCHTKDRVTSQEWSKSESYTAWGMSDNRVLAFKIENFLNDIKNSCVLIGNQDCASLGLSLATLEGYSNLRILQLVSNSECFDMSFRAVQRLGCQTKDEQVLCEKYYVLGIPKKDKNTTAIIWDPYLKVQDENNNLIMVSGMPFSEANETIDMITGPKANQYKTLLCSIGCTCGIRLLIAWIRLQELPVEKIVPGEETILDTDSNRPDFDKKIKSALVVPPYLVRCHAISYKFIEQYVARTVNESKSSEELISGLIGLWSAVCRKQPETGGADEFEQVALQCISDLNALMIQDPNNKKIIANRANQFVSALNNCLANLRLGPSDWNSCVQDNYDPFQWDYIYRPFGATEAYLMASNSGMEVKSLTDCMYLGAKVGQSGFYLSDPRDIICIKNWQSLRGTKNYTPLEFVRINVRTPDGGGPLVNIISDTSRLVLCSTANTWNLGDENWIYQPGSRFKYYSIFYFNDDGSGNKTWRHI